MENNRLIPYSETTQFHKNEYNLLRNVCNIHTKSHSKKINSNPIAKSTAAHLLYWCCIPYIETVYKVDMQAHSRFHFCQFYNSIIQLAWYFGNITSAIFQFPPHKYISLSYLCHSSLFVDWCWRFSMTSKHSKWVLQHCRNIKYGWRTFAIEI